MLQKFSAGLLGGALLLALPAAADPFSFSTGNPDGKIGTPAQQSREPRDRNGR